MAKNILIYSDGTGQEGGLRPDQNLTNIYKLYRATRSGSDSIINPTEQIAFYDAGLGTEPDEGSIYIKLIQFIRKTISSAIGLGINRNIADCYEAILKHYEPGDRIFLFGFSRGAYTVRCVANLLILCGIPTCTKNTPYCPRYGRSVREIAEEAVNKVYNHGAGKSREKFANERNEQARRFRIRYGAENSNVYPYCIGVFDTVASLGVSRTKKYLSYAVLFFITIILIKLLTFCNIGFQAATWTALFTFISFKIYGLISNTKVIRDFPNAGDFHWHIAGWQAEFYDEHLDTNIRYCRHALAIDETRSDFDRVPWGAKKDHPEHESGEPEWFSQIWFSGNHSDIGGGYPEEESRLSDITLNWMIEEMTKLPHPLIWDKDKLHIFPSSAGMQHSEIEITNDLYPRWIPKVFRLNWNKKERAIPIGAKYHSSVEERLKLSHVIQHACIAAYRPNNLKNEPQFAKYYKK